MGQALKVKVVGEALKVKVTVVARARYFDLLGAHAKGGGRWGVESSIEEEGYVFIPRGISFGRIMPRVE